MEIGVIENAGMNTETPFEPFCYPDSPTINDPIIDDSEDETIMMEDNRGSRTKIVHLS